MKALQRLEKITATATQRMQEEVAALLGKGFTFEDVRTKVASKEDIFDGLVGKMVLAHTDLEGELEGSGCMLTQLKDAIRIGGTLIMLPETELSEVCANEEYTEEIEDSFGEIANIISGSLTSSFEENHSKSFRLVRKTQEVVAPAKVDIASNEPIPDGMYFHVESAMKLDGAELGDFHLLLPAVPFGLVAQEDKTVEDAEQQNTSADGAPVDEAQEAAKDSGSASGQDTADQGEEAAQTAAKKQDPSKIKAKVDKLLQSCGEQVGSEVGALLGGELKLIAKEISFNSKEELLDLCNGKQVLARLDVRGDAEGESFLFTSLKDAIFLGGTLIMLPDSELEETVRNDEFGADAEDAYGEITNIIAGVYTAVFEEQFRKSLGFVKTKLEKIVPAKIDPDSDETIPNLPYYLQHVGLKFNDRELGDFLAVFPAEIFDIASLAQPQVNDSSLTANQASGDSSAQTGEGAQQKPGGVDGTPEEATSSGNKISSSATSGEDPNILIICENNDDGDRVGSLVQQLGYSPKIIAFNDSAQNYLPGEIQLIFLVMEKVSEQGFGAAIKVSSAASSIPLIAAGPAWTRTTVLKAVKYGADDILITPASDGDIREKIDAHLGRVAA